MPSLASLLATRCRYAAALAAGLCAGCAHVYIDADGTRNVVGFVHLQLPPAERAPAAAESLRVRAIGLTLARSGAGSALTLGYSDDTLAFVRNHSCVRLDALALRPRTPTEGERHVPASLHR